MSDPYINIRVFSWHFMLTKKFMPRITHNESHKINQWDDGYFRVYEFFNLI